MRHRHWIATSAMALPLAVLIAGCAADSGARAPNPMAPAGLIGAPPAPDRPTAYLAPAESPDGMALIPAPPAPGSAALARDLEGARQALAIRGSARWTLAAADAELFTPTATTTMACAASRQIDAKTTPATFRLLTRAAIDFSNSTASAKNHYARPRPFMENGQPSCTPEAETYLRKNGSYPSGHSAIGYGWGLVLAELIPDRTTALVARGRSFGDSRRVCNVHWLSDTEEGRVTATAVFARLQSSASFEADLAAARRELSEAAPVAPARDCAAEAAALAAG